MPQHTGGCQCGAVRFHVTTGLDRPVTCNCSRCQKLGFVLVFVPATAFTLDQGDAALTDYRFNRGVIRHRFCATCGIESFSEGTMPDGTPMVAVNVNCLDGVDPRTIATHAHPFDGKSL